LSAKNKWPAGTPRPQRERGHEIDTRGDLHTGHEAWAWGGLVGESGIDDGDEGAVQEEDGVHRGIRVLQMRGGGMVTYQ